SRWPSPDRRRRRCWPRSARRRVCASRSTIRSATSRFPSMWRPDPAWQQLAPARSSTAGVYLVPGSPARVVKRLLRPSEDDTPAHDPEHWTYWRREVEVAREEAFRTTPGLRAPAVEVHEDRAGATLVSPWVPDDRPSGEERAWALGRFAACAEPVAVWWSRPSLPDRLRSLEHGGGWRGLDATPLAGAAEDRKSVV